MDSPPFDYRLLHFWSDDISPSLRAIAWQEVLSRKLLKAEVKALSEEPLQVDASLRALHGFRFGVGLFGPSINRRTSEIVATDSDDFYLMVNLEGKLTILLANTEITLNEGDACFLACASEVSFVRRTVGRQLCARFEHRVATAKMPNIDSYAGTIVRRGSEPLRFLTSYLRDLDDNQTLSTPELRDLIVGQVFEILTLMLRAVSAATRPAVYKNSGTDRFIVTKKYILDNLDRRDLSIAQVSSTSGLSSRQIQRFFKVENTTFSEFILINRLQRAHAALTDARQIYRSIGDIALCGGFNDISYFNRAFRRHYGASPTAIRQSASNIA
jgi:AraC-like DNA-binding protein